LIVYDFQRLDCKQIIIRESLDENKIFEGDSICFGNERLAIIFAPDI
jgi:hypothetical protein